MFEVFIVSPGDGRTSDQDGWPSLHLDTEEAISSRPNDHESFSPSLTMAIDVSVSARFTTTVTATPRSGGSLPRPSHSMTYA